MRLRTLLFILLLIPCGSVATGQKPAKKITISGTVTDADEKPVAASIIIIDNKKTDYVTDLKGFYKIKIKADAVMISVFSMQKGMLDEQIKGENCYQFPIRYKKPDSNC